MSKRWLDSSRPCPSCNEPHHFVYVEEPSPVRRYWFICPTTHQRLDIAASEAVKLGYGPVSDENAKVVPAIAKFSNDTIDGAESDSEAGAGAPTKPAGSAITIEQFPDGVTIQVPPAGLWKGSHGLFALALIWLAISVPLCLCIGGGIIAGANNAQGNEAIIWLLPLLMLLFPLVGVGLLLAAINMGRRKAALAVTGGSLMVLQTGIFGSKQRQWPPGEVEAVRTGPSGMTVNDKPVLELQIYDGGADKFGLLTGRTDEELEWMAAELRAALKVRSG